MKEQPGQTFSASLRMSIVLRYAFDNLLTSGAAVGNIRAVISRSVESKRLATSDAAPAQVRCLLRSQKLRAEVVNTNVLLSTTFSEDKSQTSGLPRALALSRPGGKSNRRRPLKF